jgi:hypothetical protein
MPSTASTPSTAIAFHLRAVDARLVSQHRSDLNAPASQQLTSRCRDSGGAAFCAALDSGSDRDRRGIVA